MQPACQKTASLAILAISQLADGRQAGHLKGNGQLADHREACQTKHRQLAFHGKLAQTNSASLPFFGKLSKFSDWPACRWTASWLSKGKWRTRRACRPSASWPIKTYRACRWTASSPCLSLHDQLQEGLSNTINPACR
jgi:hypothetical protein